MEFLGDRPVWSMSGSEQLSALDAVHAELARLKTYSLHLIAGLDSIGHAKDLGAGDTARLVSMRYRRDPAEVRRDLRLATALPKYAAVSAALPDPAGDDDPEADPAADGTVDPPVDGEGGGGVLLDPAQAEAIVAALEKVPSTVPVEDIEVAEAQLVGLAAHLTPSELRMAGRRIRDLLDSDGPEPDENKAYGRETLALTNADHGVKFRGFLANENAELLRALIHAGAKPHKTVNGELDPRPRDKRQADALSAVLAAAAADTGTTGTSGGAGATGAPAGQGPRANITVTIDLDALKSASSDAIGELVYGDGLSAAAVRRLACDAKIIPLVLGTDSQPLDVGRAHRLVTGPIRTALNARDRGCVICGAPPIQTEAHHLIHWIDGGPTKVTNLALLCKRHHIDLHNGHWTIHITPGGTVQVTRPTWAQPGPTPTRYRTPAPTAPPGSGTNGSPPGSDQPPGSGGGGGGGGGGAPTRAWPWANDPGWITAEEAARLNPWGDNVPDTAAPADETARLNPWGDNVPDTAAPASPMSHHHPEPADSLATPGP